MISLSPLEMGYCGAALVLSYALRGSTGIGGFAAMPLMALVVPIKILVPVWTLLTIASSITILGKDRRHVATADMLRMAPACVVGIAIGLYFFKTVDARWLARAFGALVVAYACYSLWETGRPSACRRLPPRMVAGAAGVLGGVFGTVFGTMASLFFAIYLDARQVTKQEFRATISAMLLLLSVVRGLGYFAVGEFELESVIMFAIACPLMLLGIVIGDRIHASIDETAFKRLVCAVLIVSGVPLLLK